jgi:TRAP-type C4-dicarboxylate transport system permease small subunit
VRAGFIAIFSEVLGRVSDYLIIGMMLLISYDVVRRYAFNQPTYYTDEISGYLLVGVAFFGVATTFRADRHTAAKFIVLMLPSKVRAWLELVTLIISFVVMGVVTWFSYGLVVTSFVRKATTPSLLETPLFIPQAIVPLGLTALCLEILLKIPQTWRFLRAPKNEPGMDKKSIDLQDEKIK